MLPGVSSDPQQPPEIGFTGEKACSFCGRNEEISADGQTHYGKSAAVARKPNSFLSGICQQQKTNYSESFSHLLLFPGVQTASASSALHSCAAHIALLFIHCCVSRIAAIPDPISIQSAQSALTASCRKYTETHKEQSVHLRLQHLPLQWLTSYTIIKYNIIPCSNNFLLHYTCTCSQMGDWWAQLDL